MKDYFKSALEADFARFLRYVGLNYEYEKKTFVSGVGAYTPDFYIPVLDVYVELKGVSEGLSAFHLMMTKNLAKAKMVRNLCVITQKMFIETLRNANLWSVIPNLEQRNYRNKKLKELVITHENQKHQTKSS